MGSSFGKLFRISTWGESHGGAVGVVIDGCPPGLPITAEEIQLELDRRRPGQSSITTPRKEADQVEILSGIDRGHTLGTPIALNVRNKDARPEAYKEMRETYRPSHADFTYDQKYGRRMAEGGGRSSARETIGRVAAGAIARKILKQELGIEIVAYIERIHDISMPAHETAPSREAVEASPVRCPHPDTAEKMIARIHEVRSAGDSVGGVIRCHINGVPAGLGEPVFDRLEADLGKAMLSLPATKGFSVGSGYEGTYLKGSEHNDLFENRDGRIRTASNRSGGVQGGISNGEEIYFTVAFKPTATLIQKQQTVTQKGEPTELMGRGRHDPCVLPRAVPIVESMAALVLVDHWLRQKAQNQSCSFST
ncbi:MAG: chorismate synthase [Opitutales bacterium]|nr:chorismate synthase [Opitutales bacterium]